MKRRSKGRSKDWLIFCASCKLSRDEQEPSRDELSQLSRDELKDWLIFCARRFTESSEAYLSEPILSSDEIGTLRYASDEISHYLSRLPTRSVIFRRYVCFRRDISSEAYLIPRKHLLYSEYVNARSIPRGTRSGIHILRIE